MVIGTAAASTTTVINLTWLPAELYFIAATVPTSVKVTVLGEGVVMDLDGNGVTALSNLRGINRVTNAYKLSLADGIIKGKNVEISFTNAVASNVVLYGFGEQNGGVYIQSIRQAVLANSGAVFSKFGVVAFPAIGATDTVDIMFNDGLNQRFVREELLALNMEKQNNVGSYVIDNLDGIIDTVNIVPAAAQTAYVLRFSSSIVGAIFDK